MEHLGQWGGRHFRRAILADRTVSAASAVPRPVTTASPTWVARHEVASVSVACQISSPTRSGFQDCDSTTALMSNSNRNPIDNVISRGDKDNRYDQSSPSMSGAIYVGN